MPWPMSQDYNEAIQNPVQCFSDPELKQGESVCNAMGLPQPCSGNFADVYAVQNGQRKWAVKCFTRQIPGLKERYAAISAYLQQVALPFMVDFHFLEQGIRVRGSWYPVLKMQWVEGFTLNSFVRDNLDKPQLLQTLCEIWVKLASRLREADLAHCDLQHGNVLLVPGKANSLSLKLVDYDGMCVPALEMLKSIELGHPAYQHPQRLREGTYGLHIDRFSHLVIYTALRCLAVGGRGLWEKFDNGDNLLFSQKDFQSPRQSPVFQEVLKLDDPEIRKLVQALAIASQKSIDQVPLLDELVALPKPKTVTVPANSTPPQPEQPGAANPFAATADPRPRTRYQPKRSRGLMVAMWAVVLTILAGGAALFMASAVRQGDGSQVAQNSTTSIHNTVPQSPASHRATNPVKTVEPKVEPKPEPKIEPTSEPKINQVYLSDLPEFDVIAGPWPFAKNGKNGNNQPTAIDGKEGSKGLGMHPPHDGFSRVKYLVPPGSETFEAIVGVCDSGRPATPLVFQVFGDSKLLWESKSVAAIRQPQPCKVSISQVDVLELRVVCGRDHGGCHAVWLDPVISVNPKASPAYARLYILATIDGKDRLHITKTASRWTHISAQHPTNVRLNSREWNTMATPLMNNVGMAQWIGKEVEDLSQAKLTKIRGRGPVTLKSGKDFVTLVFDDEVPPGADVYEVVLSFPQDKPTNTTNPAP